MNNYDKLRNEFEPDTTITIMLSRNFWRRSGEYRYIVRYVAHEKRHSTGLYCSEDSARRASSRFRAMGYEPFKIVKTRAVEE